MVAELYLTIQLNDDTSENIKTKSGIYRGYVQVVNDSLEQMHIVFSKTNRGEDTTKDLDWILGMREDATWSTFINTTQRDAQGGGR